MEFPQHLVQGVVDQIYSPERSDGENIARTQDALAAQFGPLTSDQQQMLVFSIMDEISRRRGTVAEQAVGASGQWPHAGGTSPESPPPWRTGEDDGAPGAALGAGANFGDALALAIAERKREHAMFLGESGDIAGAKQLLLSSLETFRRFGDVYGQAAALSGLGVAVAIEADSQVADSQPDLAADTYVRAKELLLQSLGLHVPADEVVNANRFNFGKVAAGMYTTAQSLWPVDQQSATALFQQALESAEYSGDAELVQWMRNELRSSGIAR